MKIQIHVGSEDGKLFDVRFCSDEVVFSIIELTEKEVQELCNDIKSQVYLLKEAYENSKSEEQKKETE